MCCIALLRCAGLAALGLCIPWTARAQAPVTYTLGRDLPAFEAPSDPAASPPDLPAEPTGVVRLPDALAAALLRNPDLASEAWELRAREAALLQAHAFANPTASVELEDFAGSGPFEGVESAQTTLLLGQLVELGGKRAARIGLAAATRDQAHWDYEIRRIDVLVRTAAAFVEVLAAQERHRLAEETLALTGTMQHAATRRLRAGIGSSAEEIRAGVQADVAGVEREHTEHELATARQLLAAMWGGETPRIERAEGDLETLPAVPSMEDLAQRVEGSPGVARWQAELEQRQAIRDRAKSDRVPDVTLSAGPRRLSGPEETAMVVGLSLPLPLWNRNDGAIAEAQHRLAKAAAETRSARVRTVTELATARVGLAAAAEEAMLLRTRVLPGTERAVESLRRSYEAGRTAQIEVLDAERARLTARDQYLTALTEAHRNARQIERLTGTPLEVRQ